MDLDCYEMPSATFHPSMHMRVNEMENAKEARAALLHHSPDSSLNGNSIGSKTSFLPNTVR